MERKGLPKANNLKTGDKPGFAFGRASAGKSKIAWLSDKTLAAIKLILGVCFLILVYSSSASLLNELKAVDPALQKYFWAGVISLIILYLFIYEPAVIYQRGQRLLEVFFQFFAPLVKVAPYLLPIYSLIAFLLYGLLSLFIKTGTLLNLFIFFLGFSLSLHLVFSAKSLRSKQGDFLRANYIFGFSFLYVINMALIAACFSLIFDKFSFVNFCNNSFQRTAEIFAVLFKQLFVAKV